MLAARASELEREFAFGVVRQLFEAPRRRVAARPRSPAPPHRPPRCSRPRRAPRPRAAPRSPRCTGSTGSALNLAGRAAAPARRRRPALVRPAVAALPGLPRPPARRRARTLVAPRCARTSPATDPALLGEIAGDPATLSLQPGPLSEGAVAALVRERLGAERRPGLLRGLPRSHRRQPAAAAPAAAGARGRGGAARRRPGRGRARDRAARASPARCCCGWRGCRPTPVPWRAPPRCSARARRSAPSRRWPAATSARRPAATGS